MLCLGVHAICRSVMRILKAVTHGVVVVWLVSHVGSSEEERRAMLITGRVGVLSRDHRPPLGGRHAKQGHARTCHESMCRNGVEGPHVDWLRVRGMQDGRGAERTVAERCEGLFERFENVWQGRQETIRLPKVMGSLKRRDKEREGWCEEQGRTWGVGGRGRRG